jgi:CRP/FNR family cyclic AMP-dependent transcriptional regulator
MSRLPSPAPTPAVGPALSGDAGDWTNVVGEVPIFAELSRRHLKKVAGAGRIVRFHDGATIIRAGTPGDALYVVVDGEVSVRRRGLPAVALGIGSFFGEMALFDDSPRSASVVAAGPVTCLAISRARFHKLLRSEPPIALGLLKELARRLRLAQSVD